ncbi:MAG: penicillin-binding protein 2 [Patescibacteria group bacterium]|nr:penicillin-binding protein 2 [Patescibacteria group bacterium]
MRKIKKTAANNRLNFLLAIIFLLGLALCYRLILLQVWQHDYYSVLASSQHQVLNELKPERGQILVQEKKDGKEVSFPVAMNKDLALVYVVPYEIEDAQSTAEVFYKLFDEKEVRTEINEILNKDVFFKELREGDLSADEKKERQEFREIKFELELKNKKEEIINAYLKKLEKKFDPYEPIKRKVDKEILNKLLDLEISGVYHIMEKHRYYPDKEIGAHILGFVGYGNDELAGRYGLEGFFNEELSGERGRVKAEKSALGGELIINDWEYSQAEDGSDLYLSINRSIQYFTCQKLQESIEQYDALSGTIIIMNPNTGAIMAMCSQPSYDPNYYNEVENVRAYNNPAIFDAYEPGSIFKAITMAAGLDQGVITPQSKYRDEGQIMIEGWHKPIKNSDYEIRGGHGTVNMITVLAESLNTGSIFVQEKVGAKNFAEYVKDFGFGEKTGIELETEGLSNIVNLERNRIRPVEAATASFGQGITATPIQLVTAFSAIANGGILMKPYLVEKIIEPDGTIHQTNPQQLRRVIQEKNSFLLSGMMVHVIDGGHAKLAGVKGYYAAGKTGTAQVSDQERGGYLEKETIHSFVGFVPAEDPRFVMLIKLDRPRNAKYSASTAAPLFSKIADFILNYYQVPKER